MSSTITTITITRAERDLIRGLIWRWIPEQWGDALPFGTRAEAEDSLSRMQRGMALLDELGWDEDDPREAFTVTVDSSLVEAVRQQADDAAGNIEHETNYRDTHILGLRPTRFGTTWRDDYKTIEDADASVAAAIQHAEDEVRACESLLKRMDAGPVAA